VKRLPHCSATRSDGLQQLRGTLEAWERGRGVVVSDAGGLADSVQDGVDGLKVPMRNADAWAAAMGRMLREPAKSTDMARAGIMKLHSDYSQEKWLKRIWAIYDAVVRK
jgi:glycosyltransferase involved in cell wall biosynthesis